MSKKTCQAHRIETTWCKGCGICVAFCPKQVLAMNDENTAEVMHAEDCICCRMCELRCPDLAIEVICAPAEDDNVNE